MNQPRNNVLAIFDFDRTLITKDSFQLFSLYAADSNSQRAIGLFFAALCKLRLISNARYKEKVLSRLWSTRSESQRAALLKDFLPQLRAVQNVAVVRLLQGHLRDNDLVAVLSASPDFYLRPFISHFSASIQVVASDVCHHGTDISVNNLYGQTKAIAARRLIEQHNPEYVRVYTDHESDLPLIELADMAHLVRPSKRLLRCVRKMCIPFEVINV